MRYNLRHTAEKRITELSNKLQRWFWSKTSGSGNKCVGTVWSKFNKWGPLTFIGSSYPGLDQWCKTLLCTLQDELGTLCCTEHSTMITVYGTLYTLQSIVHTVYCTIYTVQCKLYRKLYTVQCQSRIFVFHSTVYMIKCKVYIKPWPKAPLAMTKVLPPIFLFHFAP